MMFVYGVIGNFSLTDVLVVSAFSMTVVFIVLLILQFLIGLFSKFISKNNEQPAMETINKAVLNTVVTDDSEEQLVAKIVSACFAQEGSGQNVVIRSIKRVK